MMSPTVSVLLPVFNAEAFVGQTIESLRRQTYGPVEIVVVDDGSTDATPQILLQQAGPDLHVVRQENAGVASALQRAVQIATSEILVRMDVDDISEAGRIEALVEFLAENPNILIVGSTATVLTQNEHVIGYRSVPLDADYCYWTLARRNPVIHGSTAIRRCVFDEFSYADCPLVEDYDLWCRIVSAKGSVIVNIGVPVYGYRSNPKGVSRSSGRRQRRAAFDVARKYRGAILSGKSWSWRGLVTQGEEHVAAGTMPGDDRVRFIVDCMGLALVCAQSRRFRQSQVALWATVWLCVLWAPALTRTALGRAS
jgi:glycosyltransferase involved in cell wall biosynthesis